MVNFISRKNPMLKKILFIIIPLVLLYSCTNDKKQKAGTSIDTGREFIRASLDGDFPTAEKLLLQDTQNLQLFASYKFYYEKLSQEKKRRYKEASYNINKMMDVDDSTTIINYSNDYMNKPMEIKIVKANNEWKIDFKYTSSGNLPIN